MFVCLRGDCAFVFLIAIAFLCVCVFLCLCVCVFVCLCVSCLCRLLDAVEQRVASYSDEIDPIEREVGHT
jgi:hypothetical protein